MNPVTLMFNITHIAPLGSNAAFLDSRRFPNIIGMVPGDTCKTQVGLFRDIH